MVDIWSSSWVPSLPNFRISFQKPASCPFIKVNSLIDCASGQWKFQTLSSLFSVKEFVAISSVDLSISSSEHKSIWSQTKNGIFIVKLGYCGRSKLLRGLELFRLYPSPLIIKCGSVFGSLMFLRKFVFFWWKVFQNALASRDNLFPRNYKNSPFVIFVTSKLNLYNTFSSVVSGRGRFGERVTLVLEGWIDCSCVSALSWFSHFLGNCINLSEASNVFSSISVVGWAIWKAHNDWIFNKVIPNGFKTIEFDVRLGFEFKEARSLLVHFSSSPSNIIPSVWLPSNGGLINVGPWAF
ncbi:hypothetical protein LguiA_006282 [Lonicera macranthoides]